MDVNERKWHFHPFLTVVICSEGRQKRKVGRNWKWSSMEFLFSGIHGPSTGAQMNPMYPYVSHDMPWASMGHDCFPWVESSHASTWRLQSLSLLFYIVFASHFWEARDSLRRPYGQKTQGVWRSCSTKSRKQDWWTGQDFVCCFWSHIFGMRRPVGYQSATCGVSGPIMSHSRI